MIAATFAEFYEHIHGRPPFAWQERFAAAATLPQILEIPTGCGKTSVLDALIFRVLRGDAPFRRVVYVVDRRLVVDDVFRHAQKIGKKFPRVKLARWRGGGVALDDEWVLAPERPTILISTVDQVGSRLLFRGYGRSTWERAVDAGLLGRGTVLVLDEVHIAPTFAATLEQVQKQIKAEPSVPGLPPPLEVIQMSATSGRQPDFVLSTDERIELGARLKTHKWASLEAPSDTKGFRAAILRYAEALMAADGVLKVGVILNRVEDARQIFEKLRLKLEFDCVLLIGPIRPVDREKLLERFAKSLQTGITEKPAKPIFVVATQTIEVGVDWDFDALVSEAAPLATLRQRFGRLDRIGRKGESQGAIVLRPESRKNDPIYGDAIGVAWSQLEKRARKEKSETIVDLGQAAESWPQEELEEVVPELPLDFLAETHGHLAFDVEVDKLLHAEKTSQVSLVWRRELRHDNRPDWRELISLCPPLRGEMLALGINRAREFLSGSGKGPALCLRAGADPILLQPDQDPRPEDVLVLPCDYGGADEWGFDARRKGPVDDVGNDAMKAAWRAGFRKYFRLRLFADELRLFESQPEALREEGLPELEKGVERYPRSSGLDGGVARNREERPVDDGVEQSLAAHVAQVLDKGRKIFAELGLAPELRADLEIVLRQHDAGKVDLRFQTLLAGGDEVAAAKNLRQGRPLGKGRIPFWDVAARRRAGHRLPAGWRHEIESILRADVEGAQDPALVRHLVLAHHGHGRPWIKADQDVDPLAVAEDFWQLQGKFGPWSLAYLEAIVRTADRLASAEKPKEGQAKPASEPTQPRRPRWPDDAPPEPELKLSFEGFTFLGFMAALGTLKLAGPKVRLGWRQHRAFLVGCDRETLVANLRERLSLSAFDQRVRTAEGKRRPWDLCGGGRVQLETEIARLAGDLRARPERLEETLFSPWTFADPGDPLGWIPTLREHALRARAPTKDQPFRENVALLLAWEGILLFDTLGERICCWHRNKGQNPQFTWPLWTTPVSAAVVRSLLRARPQALGAMGVECWWQTEAAKTTGKSSVLTTPRLKLDFAKREPQANRKSPARSRK